MRLDPSERLNALYYATFGANRRSVLYAILLEGVSIFGILSLSKGGYIQLPEASNRTELFVASSLVILILMYLIVRFISRETLSPKLQHPLSQLVVVGCYVLVGVFAVGVGFIFNSYIAEDLALPTRQELVIGSGISCLYGLLILVYYDRTEVDPPNKKGEFQSLGTEFLELYESLSETDRPPLQLADEYTAFLSTADDSG